jgi:molybdenum cofactor cytidylyltransferase
MSRSSFPSVAQKAMIFAVVPAAGQSRRMGTSKQLLPFGSTTVLGHVVDQLLQSRLDGVCVVVGHEAEQVSRAVSRERVRIVRNPDYVQGEMLSSIRCGLRALPAGCSAALIALGDQPTITTELVDQMVLAFSTAGPGILVPVHDGKRGHPVLIAASYFNEVLTRYDDVGLRGLLAAHPEDVVELPVSSSKVLFDMDKPEDYRRLLMSKDAPQSNSLTP